MSSPAETVNQVFVWLKQVLAVALPTLPFAGVYRRLTGLFDLLISGALPSPTDPLPWTIPLAEDWTAPIPGIAVSLDQISIQVAARTIASPTFPPPAAPKVGASAPVSKATRTGAPVRPTTSKPRAKPASPT